MEHRKFIKWSGTVIPLVGVFPPFAMEVVRKKMLGTLRNLNK